MDHPLLSSIDSSSLTSTSSLTTTVTSVSPILTPPTNGLAWSLFHLITKLGYLVAFILLALLAPPGLETPDQNPAPYQNPGQMAMAYEDLWITTKDGCKLHGWLIKQKSPLDYTTLPTLIFFQGNAGNMGLRLTNICRLYQHCRVNIFAVSYRGYGYSTGVPSENGLYIDAQAALDLLLSRNDINRSKIFVFGRSIGGAVAIDLGYKRSDQLRGIVVENTFTSLREMADIVFPFLKLFSSLVLMAQRLFMDSLSKVPSITIPIMYISGLQDALVPPAHVERLYDSTTASSLRHLYKVVNGTHNDTWHQAGAEYYQEISKFINGALAISRPPATTLETNSPPTSQTHPRVGERPSQPIRREL